MQRELTVDHVRNLLGYSFTESHFTPGVSFRDGYDRNTEGFHVRQVDDGMIEVHHVMPGHGASMQRMDRIMDMLRMYETNLRQAFDAQVEGGHVIVRGVL